MTELSADPQVSIYIDGDESFDCQKELNKIPCHSDEPFHLDPDVYLSSCIHADYSSGHPPQRRGQTYNNSSFKDRDPNQFLDEENRLPEQRYEHVDSPHNSSTQLNDRQQDTSKESSIKKTKYKKKIDKQPKGKPNNCDSKNFFLFLWKKIVKRLRNFQRKNEDEYKIINQFQSYKGSMECLNQLFSCQLLADMTEQMFQQKYFNRCVMVSSIDAPSKKKYLGFIRRVETCYKKDKRIDYLR